MQVLTIILVAAMAQHAGVLSKSDSRKLVREAEKQLAAFIRALPEPVHVRRTFDPDQPRSRYLEHRGSPLVGRICEFRCRWEFVTLATDMIAKEADHSEFVPTAPVRPEHEYTEDQRVLSATIRSSLIRLYSFKHMYPKQARSPAARSKAQRRFKAAHARKVTEHNNFVKNLRHQLRLQIPLGAKLPDADPPVFFTAIFKIISVEFDRKAEIPTMILHASLILSDDLGIKL